MTHRRPSIQRTPLLAHRRPDPRHVHWTPATLARRRALAVAREQLDAAEIRGDGEAVTVAWLSVVQALERLEADRSEGDTT